MRFHGSIDLLILPGLLILTGLGVLVWYVVAAPHSQVLGRALARGRGDVPAIALTFDDGPGPETPRVLDALGAAGVRATFFLCGANVERYPDLARRIAAEGHQIGNHTYSHPSLLLKSPGKIFWELDRTQRIIEHVSGRRPELFRPPYGHRWFGLAAVARRLGLKSVLWSVNSKDWKTSPDRIVSSVVEKAHPGAIVLLHDGSPPARPAARTSTSDALPEILRALAATYRLVTISELERG